MSERYEDQLKEQKRGYGRVARIYDLLVGLVTRDLKYRAYLFERMNIEPGARVLVLACGTGRDFKPLLKQIGPAGHITAIDYTPEMLAVARAKLERTTGATERVELIEADASLLTYDGEFDAAVCSFAITVIPGYREAYRNLILAVRPGGSVGILDVRPPSSGALLRIIHGFLSLFFPPFEEERETLAWMQRDLTDFDSCTFYFGYIFTAWGRVRGQLR